MITATSSRVILRIFLPRVAALTASLIARATLGPASRALMVFKREASSKSVSLVCKARAKDGHACLEASASY